MPRVDQCAHAAHGRHGDLPEALARQVEDADARGAAHEVAHVQVRLGGEDRFDDRVGGGDHHGRLGDVRLLGRDAEDLPPGGVLEGEDVEVAPGAEAGPHRLVAEIGHPGPGPRGPQEVEGEFAAVAVGHGGQDEGAVVAPVEGRLGDAGPLLADAVGVLWPRASRGCGGRPAGRSSGPPAGARQPGGSACSRSPCRPCPTPGRRRPCPPGPGRWPRRPPCPWPRRRRAPCRPRSRPRRGRRRRASRRGRARTSRWP